MIIFLQISSFRELKKVWLRNARKNRFYFNLFSFSSTEFPSELKRKLFKQREPRSTKFLTQLKELWDHSEAVTAEREQDQELEVVHFHQEPSLKVVHFHQEMKFPTEEDILIQDQMPEAHLLTLVKSITPILPLKQIISNNQ